MPSERRVEVRHVVDGVYAEIDGVVVEILDLSASAVRVLRAGAAGATAGRVTLRFAREDAAGEHGASGDELAMTVAARLVRFTEIEAVYAYTATLPNWAGRIARFDTFADLALPVLED